MDKEYIKITKNGEVMRRLNIFEIMDKADIILENKNVKRIYGKYVVLFLDKKCNCITYMVNSMMPIPCAIEDIEENKFDDTLKKVKEVLKEQGYNIIQSKTGVFEEVDQELKNKILEEIKYRKSLN